MNLRGMHLNADEARVTIGGFMQMPPAEVKDYIVIVRTGENRPRIATSCATPQGMLLMLAGAQYASIRGILFEDPDGEEDDSAGS